MDFILPNLLNCCIEAVVMLLLWSAFNTKPVKWWNYLVTFAALCGAAVIVSVIDSALFSILPVNFLMIFGCFMLGFFATSIANVFWNTLITYAMMVFLQVIAISLIPISLIGTHLFNFIGNGFVLAVSAAFFFMSTKYRFRDFYAQNKQQVRVFTLALCVPEMITAQFFAAQLATASKFIVLFVQLLQLLYATALLLAFSLMNRKAERRQFDDTMRHMNTLNDVLDGFKKDSHDFNKHIRYLRNLVETRTAENNTEQLQREVALYCDELLAYVNEQELLLQLDDPTFRALLYGRRSQAQQKGIRFDIEASDMLPSFPVKTYQLVEIFDNLMDNAFECVQEMTGERYIRVTLRCESRKDGTCLQELCIQNPYETLDFEALVNQDGYTSKGGTHRGIGLGKVEALVAATGGKLILGREQQIFTVKVQYLQ